MIAILYSGEVTEGAVEDLGDVVLDGPLLTRTIESQRRGDIGRYVLLAHQCQPAFLELPIPPAKVK